MTRPSASSRLRRILSLLPWVIAQRDGAPVDEVCRRFGLTRDQLLTELDLLGLVGVHPYTPDQLIEWDIDRQDRLTIRLADWFVRPLRLTPDQALALLVTGRSMLALPGSDPDGPLGRGLRKVAAVLHLDLAAIDVDLGAIEAELLSTLRSAITEHKVVDLTYYTYGRDEHSRRQVEPWRVFVARGEWYVEAFCRTSGGRRVFRVDRIDEASLAEERFEPPTTVPTGQLFEARPDDPRVTLRVPRQARWVVEDHPVERFEEAADGSLEVTLAVTARPWLERLVLQLGPGTVVVDAPPDLATAGADAARRTLARYESA